VSGLYSLGYREDRPVYTELWNYREINRFLEVESEKTKQSTFFSVFTHPVSHVRMFKL